nr:NUDIX hydrolase [Anaerolineae bacterium]
MKHISKHHIAAWVQRLPQLAFLATRVYRLTQPRFTAGVSGVIVNDQDEVLLVEHIFHARTPWGLPGGWIGNQEAPDLALMRELREELELEADVIRPLLLRPGIYGHHLDIAYLCRPLNQIGELCSEIASYSWIRLPTQFALGDFDQDAINAAFMAISTEGSQI